MSDQVVFTKEEVEKIKNALMHSGAIIPLDCGAGQYCLFLIGDCVSILDSPRPRPKMPRQMLNDVYNIAMDYGRGLSGIDVNAVEDRAHAFGFDVEDQEGICLACRIGMRIYTHC